MESGLSAAALHREGLLYVNTHGTVANLWGVCSETGLPTFASHVPLRPAPLWSLMNGVFGFFQTILVVLGLSLLIRLTHRDPPVSTSQVLGGIKGISYHHPAESLTLIGSRLDSFDAQAWEFGTVNSLSPIAL